MENDIAMTKPSAEAVTSISEGPPRKRQDSWMKKENLSEKKVLRVVSFLLLICLVVLIIAYYFKQQSKEIADNDSRYNSTEYKYGKRIESGNNISQSQQEYCLSKRCVTAAARIIETLDPRVDPCDNFYDFACGTYVNNIILPEDKSFITPLSFASDILSEKLRLLVEQKMSPKDTPSTKIVKNLYNSCMNRDRIEEDGTKPLEKIFEQLGGWPVVEGDDWNEEEFSWTETLYKIRNLGFSSNYVFSFSVTPDVKNSSWRVIELDQAAPGMPSREYLIKGINDTDVQGYLEFQVNLAHALGADKDRALEELTEIVLFEIEIANFSLPEEKRRDVEKLYNKMTIAELSLKTPSIPWLEIIQRFLSIDEKITEDEPIVIGVPNFIIELEQLLLRTSKRTIANYLLWHVAATAAPYLNHMIRSIELHYARKISGIGQEAPRWKDCMDLASNELSYAMGSLYVRNFFNKASKAAAEKMVFYIRKAFDRNLGTIEWMDKKTRNRALQKSKAIKALIGYPKEILNETVLMDHYKGLWISDGELLSNVANISKYKTNFKNTHLRKRVIKTDWKIYGDAAVVNAFYSPIDNAILFPAGILQGSFFDVRRPKYLNYGSIGFVIGHEITHGFDDEGSQFNADGDLENWWMAETREKFLEQTKCIITQYSNYTVPGVGLKLNGIVTQGENIADNGGVKGAYHAYEMWTADHGEEQKLPGLEYSPRQLFWISAAQLWCSKERDEFVKLSIMSKPHSLPRFRIIGPMSNIKEFSQDWKCSSGSKMNPKIKCSVW